MKVAEFEENIKKFSAIQNYAPFVTFFFLNGSHLTLRTFKQYVLKHYSGNENVAIFSFGLVRFGGARHGRCGTVWRGGATRGKVWQGRLGLVRLGLLRSG